MANRQYTDDFGFLRTPYIYLLLLSCGIGVLTLVVSTIFPEQATLRVWLSRLTVSIFGAYLTVAVVDHQIRKRERAETRRQRNLALHQLHSGLNRHLGFLCGLYMAASIGDDVEFPSTFEELFQGDYTHTVQHLDFSKDVGYYIECNSWNEASQEMMSDFKSEVNDILERYGGNLNSELISILLQASDNPLINPLSSGLPVQPDNQGDMNLLNGQNFDEALKMHLDAIENLISYYRSEEGVPDLEPLEEKDPWNNIQPGSARIDEDLDETDPSFGVMNIEDERFRLE